MRLIISLVLYNHSLDEIRPLLFSIDRLGRLESMDGCPILLVIHENGQSDSSRALAQEVIDFSYRVKYQFNGKNIGFGSGHNRNIKGVQLDRDDVIVIINPDIEFEASQVCGLVNYFRRNLRYSCVAPLILGADGQIQYSAKKNPTVIYLLLSRLERLTLRIGLSYKLKEYRNQDLDYRSEVIHSSYLSGCFLVCRANLFSKTRGFDERFFLHLEDADFCRSALNEGEVAHIPYFYVIHRWARGSHHSFSQSMHLIRSIFVYIWKWGLF